MGGTKKENVIAVKIPPLWVCITTLVSIFGGCISVLAYVYDIKEDNSIRHTKTDTEIVYILKSIEDLAGEIKEVKANIEKNNEVIHLAQRARHNELKDMIESLVPLNERRMNQRKITRE